jgi:hypothetical protein
VIFLDVFAVWLLTPDEEVPVGFAEILAPLLPVVVFIAKSWVWEVAGLRVVAAVVAAVVVDVVLVVALVVVAAVVVVVGVTTGFGAFPSGEKPDMLLRLRPVCT